jgi:hypothetical protein
MFVATFELAAPPMESVAMPPTADGSLLDPHPTAPAVASNAIARHIEVLELIVP